MVKEHGICSCFVYLFFLVKELFDPFDFSLKVVWLDGELYCTASNALQWFSKNSNKLLNVGNSSWLNGNKAVFVALSSFWSNMLNKTKHELSTGNFNTSKADKFSLNISNKYVKFSDQLLFYKLGELTIAFQYAVARILWFW